MIRLSDEQMALVRSMSHRHNISFAEAIRVCIDHYVVLDAERTHRHKKRGGTDSHQSASPAAMKL